MEVRLQKYFTDCGVMSRRRAESEIEAGRVKVNGRVAVLGQKIDPERDTVTYNGKRIERERGAKSVYVMLNKPRGYVTTTSDEKGRRCVTSLTEDIGVRVYPVGRLDMDSDGLLLLTNDGELANFLTHPRHDMQKVYHVRVKGHFTPEEIEKLGEPIEIDGVKTKRVKISVRSVTEDATVLRMVLYEGKNRQIRRMCEDKGIEIIKLTRVAIGDIGLDGLTSGEWRHLSRSQVAYLKAAMNDFKKKNTKRTVNGGTKKP